MNKKTLIRACLPRAGRRAGRVHPLLLARALMWRRSRLALVCPRSGGCAPAREETQASLELGQVTHLEPVEHIEYEDGIGEPGAAYCEASAACPRLGNDKGDDR